MALQGVKRSVSANDNLPSEKKSKVFDAKLFLKSLQQPDYLSSLKSFISLSKKCDEDGVDVVKDYLDGAGGIEEILKCVDINDKKNLVAATAAFSAVRIILMRILSDFPQYFIKAEVGCRYLLRAFLPIINTMLSLNSNAQQRKNVLRLLTGVVTVSSELAHEVAVQITISPPVLELLVKHTEAPNEKNTVRSCFIHYLISFFVSGSDFTIRMLLEKKGYISSIIPGLLYDSADTVVLVLATLRSKVLENSSISKTNKLRTFSTPIIRSLIGLYQWKGPKTNRGSAGKEKLVLEAEEDENKSVVCGSVHEFLILLCTSTKHGIVFIDKSLGTSGNKLNPVLYGVLQGVDQPWENELMSELVLKIMKICPDLVKSTLSITEPFLAPRASVKWERTVSFVEKVVSTVEPECLKTFTEAAGKNAKDNRLVNLVLTLTVPASPLRAVSAAGVNHTQVTVRHRTVMMLVTLLQRLRFYQRRLQLWGIHLPTEAFSAYLIQHLPDAQLMYENLRKDTNKVSEPEERVDELPLPESGCYECELLHLLLLYQQMCPQLVDLGLLASWIQKVIPTIMELQNNMNYSLMLARATWLLLTADSSALKPDSKLFKRIALALFKLVGNGCETAWHTLSVLLHTSGQLDGAEKELPVWLHSYCSMFPANRPEVASFIVDTVQQLAQNSTHYLQLLQSAEELACTFQYGSMQFVPTGSLQELFQDLMEDNFTPTNIPNSAWNYQSPSLLLVAALASGEQECDDDRVGVVPYFLSQVVVCLLHQQTSPSLFASLARLPHCRLPPAVVSHLDSWFGSSVPHPLGKPFPASCPQRKLSRKLLKVDSIVDEKPFDIDETFDSAKLCDDPDLIVFLFDQILFYVTQLALQNKLTYVIYQKSRYAFQHLIEVGCNVKQSRHIAGLPSMDWIIFDVSSEVDEFTVDKCLQAALTNRNVVELFNPLCKDEQSSDKLITDLICFIIMSANSCIKNKLKVIEYLMPLKVKFKNEMLKQLSSNRKWSSSYTRDLSEVLLCFTMERSEVTLLLDSVANSGPEHIPGWHKLLECLLDKASELRCDQVAGQSLASITDFLMCAPDAQDNAGIEDALAAFLPECPHLFGAIPQSFFRFLLKKGAKDSSIKLAILLLKHNTDLYQTFRKTLLKRQGVLECASLVFPLVTCSSDIQNKVAEDDEFLTKLYSIHRRDIEKAIKKPLKAKSWMHTNDKTIELVIKKCFDNETYLKVLPAVSENINQMVNADKFYLNLVKVMFLSIRNTEENSAECVIAFVKLLLPLVVRLSEEGKSPVQEMVILPELLHKCIDELVSVNELQILKETPVWFSFCRVCLKYGLKNENEYHFLLLPLLTRFICGVYNANSNSSETVTIFQMTVSHSRFLSIVLGKTPAKESLVKLLLALTEKAPSVMLPEHVPVLLGAYGATLSVTDQMILQILRRYESAGVTFERCQPYLWGEAAVNHYSVRVQGSSSLWQQPHVHQVLDMLNSTSVVETVTNFPAERDVENFEKLLPDNSSIYDPAFFLPLLSNLLAPESPVRPQKVIHSGALALLLAALCSQSNATRCASWHVIGQLHSHLEASRFGKECHLWLHLLNVLRCGAADIITSNEENGEIPSPKLSCIVTTFFARASLLLSQPLHPLYHTLHTFILAKPSLRLLTIPEFLPLFHSSDLQHRLHRQWILEVIRDGLKYDQDMELCFKAVLFKLLMDYYFSCLADTETKVLIMSVLESALKVPGAAKLLINGYSIIAWLIVAVDRLADDDISVSRALLSTIAALPVKSPSLPSLLVNFLSHLPMTCSDLCKYLEVLITIEVNLLSRKHIDSLLNKAEEILKNVNECQTMLQFGGKFYLQKDIGVFENDEEKAKFLLRNIVLTWLQC